MHTVTAVKAFSSVREKTYRRYSEIWNHNRGMITKVDYMVASLACHLNEIDPTAVRVLDVGCGVGTMSVPLASLGYNVVGVDVDERTIRYCEMKAGQFGLDNISFFNGFLQDCLPPDRSFHCVILADVLEHLEHPQDFLRMLQGYLKPGGIVWISIPNEVHPFSDTLNLFRPYVTLKNGIRKLGKKLLQRMGKENLIQNAKRNTASDTTPTQSDQLFNPKYFNYSLNDDSPHLQRFTLDSIQEVIQQSGYAVESVAAGSLFYKCWPLHYVFDSLVPLSELDHRVAQRFLRKAGNWWIVSKSLGRP